MILVVRSDRLSDDLGKERCCSYYMCACMHAKSLQLCPTLWSYDCSLPGSPVHGILQVGILGWVVMPSSRGSSQPRDWTHVSCIQFNSFQSLNHVLLSATPLCSMSGFACIPVHNQHPELAQTHVHRVSDAIQPYHPLSSPSPPAFSLSQHQGLFQWVKSSQVPDQKLRKGCVHLIITRSFSEKPKILFPKPPLPLSSINVLTEMGHNPLCRIWARILCLNLKMEHSTFWHNDELKEKCSVWLEHNAFKMDGLHKNVFALSPVTAAFCIWKELFGPCCFMEQKPIRMGDAL